MKMQGIIIILFSFLVSVLHCNWVECSYRYRQTLYQLHDSYQEEAMRVTQNNDHEMAQRCINRMQAIVKTIANPSQNVFFSPLLRATDSIFYKLGKIYGSEWYDNFLTQEEGTPLDQELHTELTTTLQETAELISQNPTNPYVHTNALFIYHFTALAQKQTNPAIAFKLSDLCFHLKRASTKLTNIITQGTKIITHGIGKGVTNYFEYNFKHTFEALKQVTHDQSPLKTLYQEYITHIHDAGTALLKAVQYAYNEPYHFSQDVQALALQLKQTMQDRPETVVALIIEMLLPASINKLMSLKKLEPLVNALQEQRKLATTLKEKPTTQAPQQPEAFTEPLASVINPTKDFLQRNEPNKRSHRRR